MKSENVVKTATLAQEHFSVAVHYMRMLTDYAARQDLSTEYLLKQAGIPSETLTDPNGRVPFNDFSRACDLAAEFLHDPCLGLKLGQSIRSGHLGSHGFALMSCSNGEELLRQSTRYSALTIDAGHNEFEQRGKEFIRIWRSNLPNDVQLGWLQDDLHQATFVTLARFFSNREDLNPNWVSFRHAKPDDTQEYDALFRCPVRFNAPETAMSFNAEYLEIPLPHANPQLRRIMDDLCSQLLKQLGNAIEPAWLAIARKTVLDSFKQGMIEIGDVVKATGLTESQLKDQLAERGLSFRGFVDDLRHALALGYTRDPSLSLVDIAYLLGFSEQSAFQRAFKRWTGMTPGDYRQQRSSTIK